MTLGKRLSAQKRKYNLSQKARSRLGMRNSYPDQVIFYAYMNEGLWQTRTAQGREEISDRQTDGLIYVVQIVFKYLEDANHGQI